MIRQVLFWPALLTVAGCAETIPQPESANVSYYSVTGPVRRGAIAAHLGISNPEDACIRIVDERQRTVAENWSLPREQIRDWLVEGIQSRLGLTAEYTDESPAAGGYLALESLYIRRISTTMTAVTVLRAYGSERSRAVRGNSTLSNTAASDRATSRVLSASLDDAMKKLPLQPIINRNCS